MRIRKIFKIPDNKLIKKQILSFVQDFNNAVILDSNNYKSPNKNYYNSDYDFIAGLDIIDIFSNTSSDSFTKLYHYYYKKKDWLFGYFSYDLKNQIENLNSANFDGLNFPNIHFMNPRYVIIIKNNSLVIEYLKEYDDESTIEYLYHNLITKKTPTKFRDKQIVLKQRISKHHYINNIESIKKHIYRGDIYELNYCQEFYDENAEIDPFWFYTRMQKKTQAPFSCFYKFDNKYIFSASPERFLKKKGQRIISQPIKGTQKRGKNKTEDKKMINGLKQDIKERAENIMIVDLVRNDLTHYAIRGSVKVEELCEVYTFKSVHQLISTISAEIDKKTIFTDVIKSCFPMGSMTGAPKIKAMELIEKYEECKRGVYSGAIGYISPNENFDFNVVIRTALYNSKTKYLSYTTGGAITNLSNAQKEFEECLLKAYNLFTFNTKE